MFSASEFGLVYIYHEWIGSTCIFTVKVFGLYLQLVAGSAIQAFEEVCPERIDLIHKNYRKLCNLLVDVEEWGQVVIVGMMTRYARTQFVSPNQEVSDQRFNVIYQQKFLKMYGKMLKLSCSHTWFYLQLFYIYLCKTISYWWFLGCFFLRYLGVLCLNIWYSGCWRRWQEFLWIRGGWGGKGGNRRKWRWA